MNILPSECDCQRCSKMCEAPCCGTVEDIQRLIDAGFGDRLMLDDWPGQADMIKPAMKGSESERAPWAVSTEEGCTFWKKGKCELHNLGLKPLQGKLALHGLSKDENDYIGRLALESWGSEEASNLINQWKKDFLAD